MANQERSNHVVFRTQMHGDGTKSIDVQTPEKVLPCHTAEELKEQLKHYAQGLLSLTTANSQVARRKYVELIRPALRYFCKKFNVEVPKWLANDDYYAKTMSAAERQKNFGMKPLRIGEFQKLKPIPGAEGISYPGREETPEEKEEKADGEAKR